jgi:hypothetical protein
MDTYSRSKKNEQIHSQMESNRETDLSSPKLNEYARRLNAIDPNLSSVNQENVPSAYSAIHSKRESSYAQTLLESESESANHDYINEFINEAKNYNINKGYRDIEDTDSNVLHTVMKKNDSNHLDDEDELTAEIKNILQSDFSDEIESQTKIKQVINPDIKDMLEETQKIKLKLDDYERELLGMNRKVSTSNRILNAIVFILVIVLIVILGLSIYWILFTKAY